MSRNAHTWAAFHHSSFVQHPLLIPPLSQDGSKHAEVHPPRLLVGSTAVIRHRSLAIEVGDELVQKQPQVGQHSHSRLIMLTVLHPVP